MSGNGRCGWSSVGGKTPSTWCCSNLAHLPISLRFSSGCLWCHIFFELKRVIVLNTFVKKSVRLQITILKSQTTKTWWSYPVLQEGIGPWQLEAHRPRSAIITPTNSFVVREHGSPLSTQFSPPHFKVKFILLVPILTCSIFLQQKGKAENPKEKLWNFLPSTLWRDTTSILLNMFYKDKPLRTAL